MNYKKLSAVLGLFSVALGTAELFAARKVSRSLAVEGHERLVRGFGLRDVATGIGILGAPAVSTNIWGRVAGDVMNLVTLAAAGWKKPRRPSVRRGLGIVIGVTLLDVVVALGLDKQTGKMMPTRNAALALPPAA